MRNVTTTVVLAWCLAVIAAVLTPIILLVPTVVRATSLGDRGQTSAAVSSAFALILSVIAVIVTARVNSSDYRAEQDVRMRTAQLLATLRSIMVKSAMFSQKPRDNSDALDLAGERRVLNDFLSSTTAFAYWSWSGYKSVEAGDNPEEWRVFFMYLADILDSERSQLALMLNRAAVLEKLLAGLDKKAIRRISSYVSDLSGAIGDFEKNRESNALIKEVFEVYGVSRNLKITREMLLHLKRKGIADPNIDLWLAVMEEDPARLKSALAAGADQTMTDSALVAKYQAELKDVASASH